MYYRQRFTYLQNFSSLSTKYYNCKIYQVPLYSEDWKAQSVYWEACVLLSRSGIRGSGTINPENPERFFFPNGSQISRMVGNHSRHMKTLILALGRHRPSLSLHEYQAFRRGKGNGLCIRFFGRVRGGGGEPLPPLRTPDETQLTYKAAVKTSKIQNGGFFLTSLFLSADRR